MKQEKKVTLTVLLFIALVTQAIIIPFQIVEAQVTVGTSTSNMAVRNANQRKSFYAEGLFWVFYSDGTNAGWEFSADGVTWAGAFTSIGSCAAGFYFSVWFDGTYIHYARDNGIGDLYYRRGTPVNDGSISWSAAEQTVYDGTTTDEYKMPCITVDTDGYVWIGVNNDQPDGDDFPVVLKNNNTDGTWVTDFIYELSAVDSTSWFVSVVPLTGGKVYVIYCRAASAPLGKLYNAGWGAEESDLADFDIEQGYLHSAVALSDNVHFVYTRDGTNQIRHNRRIWGVGWDAADVLVQDSLGENSPALSSDPSTGDLYCFWTLTSTDHVYYKQYTGGAWDVGATDWIDESADDIIADWLISSFYMDYGGYIGLIYLTKLGSPYNVRFDFLTMLVNQAPSRPILTSPTNNTIYRSSYPFNSTWVYSDPDGDPQGAYQLVVDNNTDFSSTFYDSGKVASSNNWQNYTGPTFFDLYYWRVTVWDSVDDSNTSLIGRYHVGPYIQIQARNNTSPIQGVNYTLTQNAITVYNALTNSTGHASGAVRDGLNTTLTIEQTGYGSVNMSFIASHEDYMVFTLSSIGGGGFINLLTIILISFGVIMWRLKRG